MTQRTPAAGAATVEVIFRAEYGRAAATLIRFLGDIDLAEEAVQEAFLAALARWPATGVPPNPGGWIVTTARNRALDRLRRERTPRRPAGGGGAAARTGTNHGQTAHLDRSPTTGSGCSSPAATRRWRWRPGSH